jgi:hypothetical protein
MSHKTDIELITLKHVLHRLRDICEDGIRSKDDPDFYAEPAPEDCLLAVKKMVKQRKKELKAAKTDIPLEVGTVDTFVIVPDPASPTKTRVSRKKSDGGY